MWESPTTLYTQRWETQNATTVCRECTNKPNSDMKLRTLGTNVLKEWDGNSSVLKCVEYNA
jgi:hypothetical protein